MNKDNFSIYNSISYIIQCKGILIISLLYINHIDLSASNHSHRMVSITMYLITVVTIYINNLVCLLNNKKLIFCE